MATIADFTARLDHQTRSLVLSTSEDSLKAALKREQETARDLRAENLDLRKQLQAMASVNEALRQEVRILHATGHAKVVSFVPGAPTR